MSYIIPKRILEGLGDADTMKRINESAGGQGFPMSDGPHSEPYVDSEGEERCATCDKWLEPGYYTIEDHRRAEQPHT